MMVICIGPRTGLSVGKLYEAQPIGDYFQLTDDDGNECCYESFDFVCVSSILSDYRVKEELIGNGWLPPRKREFDQLYILGESW